MALAEKIPPESPRLTEAEYLEIERAAEGKSEFIDGEMYALGGASYAHNVIVWNLARALGNALAGTPCRAVGMDQRVKVTLTGLYTYPDVVIVCGEPRFADSQFDTLENPTVLIEVLSSSTEAWDRGRKFEHSRRIESLREVVLFAQDRPLAERFSRWTEGDWLLHTATGLGAVLELASIGVRFSLAEIYEGALARPTPPAGSDLI